MPFMIGGYSMIVIAEFLSTTRDCSHISAIFCHCFWVLQSGLVRQQIRSLPEPAKVTAIVVEQASAIKHVVMSIPYFVLFRAKKCTEHAASVTFQRFMFDIA